MSDALNVVSSVSAEDVLPVSQNSSTRYRGVTVDTLADYMQDNLDFSKSSAWVMTQAYEIGQIVSYSGYLYIASQPTTGNQPNISPTYWTLVKLSVQWASVTPYAVGDFVAYNGYLYIAIQATTGNQPDTSPTYWTPAQLSVKATGSTTYRTLSNRFADVVNVKDFGAVGDGVTDDTAAFNAAIAYANDGQVVYVPRSTGTYLVTIASLSFGGKRIIFHADDALLNGTLNTNLPGVYETTYQGGVRSIDYDTVNNPGYRNFYQRFSNGVGTPGNVNTNFTIYTSVASSVASYEWALLGIVDNYATAGENVAVYGQGNKRSTGPTWGGVMEAIDHTATVNPTTGLIGLEVDVRASSSDNNRQRIGVDVVISRSSEDLSGSCKAAWGYRVQGDAGVGKVEIAYGTDATLQSDIVFDSSQTLAPSGDGIALRMRNKQWISLEATNQRQIRYNGTSSRFEYTTDGGTTIRFAVQDDGTLVLGGAPNKLTWTTAAPASGTWSKGDRAWNSQPAVGSPKGWICTVAGTPGTWVSEGNL